MLESRLHFRIAQDKLARLVAQAIRATPRKTKSAFPVLDFILLEGSYTEDELAQLRLTAYNGELALELATEEFELITVGKVLLPAISLGQLISSLPDKQLIELKVEEREEAVIRCGTSRNTLKGYFPLSDFPLIPSKLTANPSPVLLMTGMLKRAIGQVSFAAAEEENGHIINNVCLRFGLKEAAFASTDGVQLAIKQIPLAHSQPDQAKPYQALLPAFILSAIRGLLDEAEYQQVELGLNPNGSMLVVKSAGSAKFCLSVSLVAGAFPDYKKFIPTQYRTRMVVGVEELLRATRIAAICLNNSKDSGQRWNFQLTVAPNIESEEGSGQLVVSSSSSLGSSETPIEVLVEGESNQIALQPGKLLEILRAVEANKWVVLEMEDKSRPLVIKPYEEGEKWLFLLMAVSSTVSSNQRVEAEDIRATLKKGAKVEAVIEEVKTAEAEILGTGEIDSDEAAEEVAEALEVAESSSQPEETTSAEYVPIRGDGLLGAAMDLNPISEEVEDMLD